MLERKKLSNPCSAGGGGVHLVLFIALLGSAGSDCYATHYEGTVDKDFLSFIAVGTERGWLSKR